jgi:hypothetical protein
MRIHAELRHLIHHLARHAQLVDEHGFGYSRDLTDPAPAAVPDGVDLYHLTGRTRQEATR